ncbi:hypothetical protein GGS20DRAFT_570681 [Poronia punctata]|nr:hypothetical protein GGS20DRAFT_570681 [Poronia punctata]
MQGGSMLAPVSLSLRIALTALCLQHFRSSLPFNGRVRAFRDALIGFTGVTIDRPTPAATYREGRARRRQNRTSDADRQPPQPTQIRRQLYMGVPIVLRLWWCLFYFDDRDDSMVMAAAAYCYGWSYS